MAAFAPASGGDLDEDDLYSFTARLPTHEPDPYQDTRKCNRCGSEKPAADFALKYAGAAAEGLVKTCVGCRGGGQQGKQRQARRSMRQ
jgi:hypothetical protein